MRVADGSEGVDIVSLVEQQPALLLQADTAVSSDEEETAAERLQVWGGHATGLLAQLGQQCLLGTAVPSDEEEAAAAAERLQVGRHWLH